MKKYSLHSSRIMAFAFMLSLVISGCVKEVDVSGNEADMEPVFLKVNTRLGTNENVNTTAENRLKKLRLLAFHTNGKIVTNQVVDIPDDSNESPSFKILENGYLNDNNSRLLNLFFIGNELPAMTQQLDAVTGATTMRKNPEIMIQPYSYDPDFDPVNNDDDNFMMTNALFSQIISPNDIDPVNRHYHMNLNLIRNLAKIEVVVVKDEVTYPASADVRVTEISFTNISPRYLVTYNVGSAFNSYFTSPENPSRLRVRESPENEQLQTIIIKEVTEGLGLNYAKVYVPGNTGYNDLAMDVYAPKLNVKMVNQVSGVTREFKSIPFTVEPYNVNIVPQNLNRTEQYYIKIIPRGFEDPIEIETKVTPWGMVESYVIITDMYSINIEDIKFTNATNTITVNFTVPNNRSSYTFLFEALNGATINGGVTSIERTSTANDRLTQRQFSITMNKGAWTSGSFLKVSEKKDTETTFTVIREI